MAVAMMPAIADLLELHLRNGNCGKAMPAAN
jgi:hypothetical protein